MPLWLRRPPAARCPGRALEGDGEEQVAGQDRRRNVEDEMRGAATPADLRLVDDVVVKEAPGVGQLDGRDDVDVRGGIGVPGPEDDAGQQGTRPLAPPAEHVVGRPFDAETGSGARSFKTLLDRDAGNGYAVSVGRIRPCPLFDYKFVVLGHNTLRGAAGGSIHNAELLVAQKWIA